MFALERPADRGGAVVLVGDHQDTAVAGVDPGRGVASVEGAEGSQTPWISIGIGVAVLVAVVGGLILLLSDDGDSDSASEIAELNSGQAAVDFAQSVDANRAIRFRVAPESGDDLDLAMVIAADRDDVVSMSKLALGDEADGLDDDEVLARLGFVTLADSRNSELIDYGIDPGLIELGYRNDNGPGEAEADYFAAPDDVELHIVTFDVGFATGEVGFMSQTLDGEIDATDSSSFDQEWFDESSFYGVGFFGHNPFVLGGGLFGDLFDELPGGLDGLPDAFDGLFDELPGDFNPEDFLGDLPDELDGLFDDLPDELDGLFDDLPDEFEDLEDYFGELFGESNGSIPGLEEFLEGLLEGEN
ncbi:MAG: hypothetical protein IH940_13005 [Acidobacteria bacterium]|nr:hypothetical protein [Acidobacteriota bacterium]